MYPGGFLEMQTTSRGCLCGFDFSFGFPGGKETRLLPFCGWWSLNLGPGTLRSFECRSAMIGLRTFLKSSLTTERVIRYAVAGHEEFLRFMCFHFYEFSSINLSG